MKEDQLTIYEKAERAGRTEHKNKKLFDQEEEAQRIRSIILKPKQYKHYI